MVETLEEMNNRWENEVVEVSIEDFDMPFTALVGFLVKVAFASIPALIILVVALALLWGVFLGALFSVG